MLLALLSATQLFAYETLAPASVPQSEAYLDTALLLPVTADFSNVSALQVT